MQPDRTTAHSDHPSDSWHRALAATHARLRTHARIQLALYALFAVLAIAAMMLVAGIIWRDGVTPLVSHWPALVAQLGGLAVLALLLRIQIGRLGRLRRQAMPVRQAVQVGIADVVARQRQSRMLLALAAVSVPALLMSVLLMSGTGRLDPDAARSLALLCLLPGLVIGAVHGSRLRRARIELDELQHLLTDLGNE